MPMPKQIEHTRSSGLYTDSLAKASVLEAGGDRWGGTVAAPAVAVDMAEVPVEVGYGCAVVVVAAAAAAAFMKERAWGTVECGKAAPFKARWGVPLWYMPGCLLGSGKRLGCGCGELGNVACTSRGSEDAASAAAAAALPFVAVWLLLLLPLLSLLPLLPSLPWSIFRARQQQQQTSRVCVI